MRGRKQYWGEPEEVVAREKDPTAKIPRYWGRVDEVFAQEIAREKAEALARQPHTGDRLAREQNSRQHDWWEHNLLGRTRWEWLTTLFVPAAAVAIVFYEVSESRRLCKRRLRLVEFNCRNR